MTSMMLLPHKICLYLRAQPREDARPPASASSRPGLAIPAIGYASPAEWEQGRARQDWPLRCFSQAPSYFLLSEVHHGLLSRFLVAQAPETITLFPEVAVLRELYRSDRMLSRSSHFM